MKKLVVSAVVAGLVGAVVFWLYQFVFQGNTIPAFIGAQIVDQGGYALPPGLVGWTVHLGVSLSYALLLGLLMWISFTRSAAGNRLIGLLIALVLGWVTNMIAPPAIQVTIRLLSGRGLPASYWPLNPASGHSFWNHLLFFIVVWVIHTATLGFSKKS